MKKKDKKEIRFNSLYPILKIVKTNLNCSIGIYLRENNKYFCKGYLSTKNEKGKRISNKGLEKKIALAEEFSKKYSSLKELELVVDCGEIRVEDQYFGKPIIEKLCELGFTIRHNFK
jgi:hypothetical protein